MATKGKVCESDRPSVLMFDAAFPMPVIGGKEKQAYLLTNELVKGKRAAISVLTLVFSDCHSDKDANVKISRVKKTSLYTLMLATKLVYFRKNHNLLHIHTPSRIGRYVAIFGRMLGYRILFKIPNEGIIAQFGLSRLIDLIFFALIPAKLIILETKTWDELYKNKFLRPALFYAPNGVETRKQKQYKSCVPNINILFVGRLVSQKGCDKLIRTLSLLDKDGVGFSATIVGDGKERLNLEKLVADLNLVDRVTFVGNRKDVIDYMYSSDVIVNTSCKEGMSNVLLEAMSVGLPIVGTRVGALKEQLGAYYDKFSVPVESAETELAEKIKKLLQDTLGLQRYGTYLHSRSTEIFSISRAATKYLDQYRRIVRKC